ncbi:MAG: ABC transporter ATP-binding protein [Anaerolineae bacterium]|jgi:ABC-type multidrug transport system fused ATPase/permease subunit
MAFSFTPGGGHGPHLHVSDFEDVTGKAFDRKITMKLLAYLKPYKREMAWGVLWMFVGAGLALLTPYLIKQAFDAYIAVGDAPGLTYIALLTLGAYGLEMVATWQRSLTLQTVGNKILNTMRGQLFAHYQRLSMSYFDKHGTGSLISRVLSDVGVINELLSQGLITMLSDIVMLVSIVVVMLVLDTRLALLTFAVLPLMVVATYLFGRRARVAYRTTREKVSILTGRLAEDINAMRVVQAFTEEDRMGREFSQINRDNRNANVEAARLASIFTPSIEVLSTLTTGIILWFGGRAVAQHTVTLGVIVAFLSYTARLFQPILDLSMMYNTWQSAMAGGERILGILAEEPDIQDKPDALPLPSTEGHVEFRNVSFRYVEDAPVLRDVSFEVLPGETVALVGPTGAGKTTIAALLSRYYDVDEGAILVDGIDIRNIKVGELRRQLGVVPQEPYLFGGTIAYNIAFGRPDASIEQIIAAAEAANAHEFISSLPRGYDTDVQEGATNLSLGQRQLVCLARVILAEPQILILDEATSSVDLRTEGLIQDAIERLMAARSSLVIAHRLATVQRADKILVIDGGRIVERGTHAELVEADALYARLYASQFITA